MASEEETTSDSCTVKATCSPVPRNLLPYVRSRVLHYVNESKDFSAEIQQTSETDARLVFYHGANFAEERETKSSVDDRGTSTGNIIIVKNLPQSIDEDILELFFESGKKVGAGPVKSVQLNRPKKWAIIEFCELGAVEVVMNKKPLTLLDTTLDIHPYAPLLQGDKCINGVEIRGLSSELTQDILSVQTEGIPNSYAASHTDEAVNADDPGRIVVTEEETISNLKPAQLRMLSATLFPIIEEKKRPNMKVEIDHSKNKAVFKGERADILHTKLHMYKTLSEFSIRVLNIPESHVELFKAKQVQKYIAEKLETNELVCAWEVTDSELIICSSEADIASCVTIVSESVKVEIIPANSESVCILYSQQWPARLTDLHKESRFIYKVDSDASHKSIHIITTDDISNEVVDIVKKFLKKHIKIQTENIDGSTSRCKQLLEANKLCPDLFYGKARELGKDLSMHYVSVSFFYDKISISGTWEGIALAKKSLSITT